MTATVHLDSWRRMVSSVRGSCQRSNAVYLARHRYPSGWTVFRGGGGSDLCVAFRGSSSAEDFMNAFDIRTARWPTCRGGVVHRGFHDRWAYVQGEVARDLRRHLAAGGVHGVTFTGHSLGGALAVMAGVSFSRMLADHGVRARCHTFGMPQIGNMQFVMGAAEAMGDNLVSVQSTLDVIPYLPVNRDFWGMHNVIELSPSADDDTTAVACALGPQRALEVGELMRPLISCGEPLRELVRRHSLHAYARALDHVGARLSKM